MSVRRNTAVVVVPDWYIASRAKKELAGKAPDSFVNDSPFNRTARPLINAYKASLVKPARKATAKAAPTPAQFRAKKVAASNTTRTAPKPPTSSALIGSMVAVYEGNAFTVAEFRKQGWSDALIRKLCTIPVAK